jgi:hypothetical protein
VLLDEFRRRLGREAARARGLDGALHGACVVEQHVVPAQRAGLLAFRGMFCRRTFDEADDGGGEFRAEAVLLDDAGGGAHVVGCGVRRAGGHVRLAAGVHVGDDQSHLRGGRRAQAEAAPFDRGERAPHRVDFGDGSAARDERAVGLA